MVRRKTAHLGCIPRFHRGLRPRHNGEWRIACEEILWRYHEWWSCNDERSNFVCILENPCFLCVLGCIFTRKPISTLKTAFGFLLVRQEPIGHVNTTTLVPVFFWRHVPLKALGLRLAALFGFYRLPCFSDKMYRKSISALLINRQKTFLFHSCFNLSWSSLYKRRTFHFHFFAVAITGRDLIF